MNVISWMFLGCLSTSLSSGLAHTDRVGDINLGKLHWCDTLCLCHDDTQETLHCFTEMEIYSLLHLDTRKAQRLAKSNFFRVAEKLMWCSETCLCHKSGRKEFKCSDKSAFAEFLQEKAPDLVQYLESNQDEDVPPEEQIQEEHHKPNKHRKHRKKSHHKEVETIPSSVAVTTEKTPVDVQPSQEEETFIGVPSTSFEPSGQVSQASILSQRSPSSVVKVPLQGNYVAGEVTEDIYELREHIEKVKKDVALNQHILLASVIISFLAIIGVMILAIYFCCSHKSSKTKNNQNGATKTNLQERIW